MAPQILPLFLNSEAGTQVIPAGGLLKRGNYSSSPQIFAESFLVFLDVFLALLACMSLMTAPSRGASILLY